MTEQIKETVEPIEANDLLASIVDSVQESKKIDIFKERLFSNSELERVSLLSYNSMNNDYYSFKRSNDAIPLFCLMRPHRDSIGVARTSTYFDSIEGLYKTKCNVINYINGDSDDITKKVIEKLFENYDNRSIIMFSHEGLFRASRFTDIESLKKRIKDYYHIYMGPTNYFHHYSNYYGGIGVTNLVKSTTSFNLSSYGKISTKGGPTEIYDSNYYFCAKRRSQTLGNVNIVHVDPLYSLMVKKEYINYVKTCIFYNIKPNPEAYELWINESLDNPKSGEPIRLQFNKLIRKPLEAQGVKTVVFANLKEQMMNYPVIKTFKSIPEEKAFIKGVFEKFIKEEKKRYGIIDRTEELDKMIEEIMDSPANTILDDIPF